MFTCYRPVHFVLNIRTKIIEICVLFYVYCLCLLYFLFSRDFMRTRYRDIVTSFWIRIRNRYWRFIITSLFSCRSTHGSRYLDEHSQYGASIGDRYGRHNGFQSHVISDRIFQTKNQCDDRGALSGGTNRYLPTYPQMSNTTPNACGGLVRDARPFNITGFEIVARQTSYSARRHGADQINMSKSWQ